MLFGGSEEGECKQQRTNIQLRFKCMGVETHGVILWDWAVTAMGTNFTTALSPNICQAPSALVSYLPIIITD
eukprot:6490785-Amphidinium_carterae.2